MSLMSPALKVGSYTSATWEDLNEIQIHLHIGEGCLFSF